MDHSRKDSASTYASLPANSMSNANHSLSNKNNNKYQQQPQQQQSNVHPLMVVPTPILHSHPVPLDNGLELNPNMHTTIRSYLEQYTADDFELIDKLYINGDSVVYKAKWITVPSGFLSPFVAIKQRLTSELGRNADVLHEAKLNVRHPNIVRCYGSYWKPVTSLNMIFEWADGGDLLSVVRNRRQRYNLLPEYDIWRWSEQLFSALDCLHRRRIIHRDIKCSNLLLFSRENAKNVLIQHLQQQMDSSSSSSSSSSDTRTNSSATSIHTNSLNPSKPNILLGPMAKNAIKGNPIASSKLSSSKSSMMIMNKDSLLNSLLTTPNDVPLPSPIEYPFLYDLKVADLGVARRLGMGGEFANTMYGTPLYMSPELVDVRGPNYTNKTDVWSAGVSIYEIAALTSPFTGTTMAQLTHSVRSGRYKPLPSFYSKELHDFISLLLQTDPDKRPNSRDALDICTNWLNKQNNGAGDIEAIRQGAVTDRRAILRDSNGSNNNHTNNNTNSNGLPQQSSYGGGIPSGQHNNTNQQPIREKAQDIEGAETRALMYPDRVLADENLSLVARAKATAAAARNYAHNINYEEETKAVLQSNTNTVLPSRPRTAPSNPTRSISSNVSSPAGIIQSSLNARSPSGPTASIPLIDGPTDPYVSGKLLAQQIQNNPKVIRVKVRRKGHTKGETLHVEAPLPPPTNINEYGIPEEDEENSLDDDMEDSTQLPIPSSAKHKSGTNNSSPSGKHYPARAKSPVIVVPTSPRSSEVRYMPVSRDNVNNVRPNNQASMATSYDMRPPSARYNSTTNKVSTNTGSSISSSRPSTASSIVSKTNSIHNTGTTVPGVLLSNSSTTTTTTTEYNHRNNADLYAERNTTGIPIRLTNEPNAHSLHPHHHTQSSSQSSKIIPPQAVLNHHPRSTTTVSSSKIFPVPIFELPPTNEGSSTNNNNSKIGKSQQPILINQKFPSTESNHSIYNNNNNSLSSSNSQTYLSYSNGNHTTPIREEEEEEEESSSQQHRHNNNQVSNKEKNLRQWRQEASDRRAEIAERNKERWQRELAAAGVL